MDENAANKLPSREEIDSAFKWHLSDMYTSIDSWEKDLDKIKGMAENAGRFQGKLGADAQTLLKCIEESNEMMKQVEKLFAFARMSRDENNANPVFQAATDRAAAVLSQASASISYITPELVGLDKEIIDRFMKDEPKLQMYKQYFDNIMRRKEHVLSEKEEKLLALSEEMAEAPSEIYSMYLNADIRFKSILDENENEIEVTKGRYIKLLESKNRRVRKDAFKSLYGTYESMKNTLACSLSNQVKRDRFYSYVRKYESTREAALNSDNIPTTVYDNLISTIHKNLSLMHRYVSLRKKALKLNELHMYDLYTPIVEEPKSNIPFAEAKEMVKAGLAPMGKDYIAALDNAFKSGWIDVYENRGKTSGAYSWGNYLTHPFVLLNYQGTVDDVFTLAHEMGHALHSWNTNNTQPYVYSHYSIFSAEVASTVNESLLLEHLINNTDDKKMKAYLLNHQLEAFRGTLFRQTMFAEFEKIIHENYANGIALTAESLCDIYLDLNKKYFGDDIVIDDEIRLEWARIPHFYTSFYVFQYATGISAATALSAQILSEGKPAVDRYTNFLKSGNSNYSIELLKKAGVDLTKPEPVVSALKVFEKALNDMEKILKEDNII